MCPSEILNEILNTSTNEVKKIEEEYINTFAYFIKQTSGTLYYKLIESMYAEPQEYSMLLRTGFLADSLVPISIIETFYAFLKRYHYLYKEEITKCMKDIMLLHGNQNIAFWKKVPWIDEIYWNEKKKQCILSSQGNTFSFYNSNSFLAKDIEIIRQSLVQQKISYKKTSLPNGYNIVSNAHFDYKCHEVAYQFSKLHKDIYAVTSICPFVFQNHHWLHSYNVSKDYGVVLDLVSGFIMPIDEFENLMSPQVLCETIGINLSKRLKEIENSSWPLLANMKNAPLKKLAFYSFDSLNYQEQEKIIRSLKK